MHKPSSFLSIYPLRFGTCFLGNQLFLKLDISLERWRVEAGEEERNWTVFIHPFTHWWQSNQSGFRNNLTLNTQQGFRDLLKDTWTRARVTLIRLFESIFYCFFCSSRTATTTAFILKKRRRQRGSEERTIWCP